MKTFSFLPALLAFCLLLSCRKSGLPDDLPACIKAVIETNQNNADWQIGEISEYAFQGRVVYAFEPDNRIIADGSTDIKTGDCVPLCSVGGFGGPSVNLCNEENFFEKAVLIRVVWKKP